MGRWSPDAERVVDERVTMVQVNAPVLHFGEVRWAKDRHRGGFAFKPDVNGSRLCYRRLLRSNTRREHQKVQRQKLTAQRQPLTAQRQKLTAQRQPLTAQRQKLTAQRQKLTAQRQKLTVQRHAAPYRRIVAGGVLPECARPCLRPFGSLTGLVVNRSGR